MVRRGCFWGTGGGNLETKEAAAYEKEKQKGRILAAVCMCSLSFDMLLAGYSTKDDGTIVITRGDRVIASNEDSLVGANVDAIAVLRRIKESIGSGTLLHTVRWKTDRRKVRFLIEKINITLEKQRKIH